MVRTEVLERRIAGISEKIKSDFRIEYEKDIPDQALFDDVVSYLGEYRFSLPQYSYDYIFSQGKLRDPHRNDSMEDVSQRAIDSNSKKGKSSFREQAEKKAFQKLDHMLSSAKTGDTVIWLSLPGPKEENYGDYGFFFLGKVGEINGSEKKIKMKAIRVEHPTIEQANQTISLLTSKETQYHTVEDCLSDPHVLPEDLNEEYIFSVLKMVFSFTPKPEEQKKFELIVQKMFPLVSDFIQSAKNPWKTKTEKIKELYSLENYALKLKKDYEQSSIRKEDIVIDFKPILRLPDIVGEYGKPPPKVAGSCPAGSDLTSELTSSNILSKGSFLNNLFEGQEWFHCPKCDYQADGPIGDTCPECGLTKQAYAEEAGVSCA